MCPDITPQDHGVKYWVGMQVDGDTQLSDAYVVKWAFDNIPEPTIKQIKTMWNRKSTKDEYAAMLAERNKPKVLSRYQILAAFAQLELLDAVEAYITTAPTITKLAYQNLVTFTRDSDVVGSIATALKLTNEQLDNLFDVGSKIKP